MAASKSEFLALRGKFRGLSETGHKQMGLRAIRDGLNLLHVEAYAAEKLSQAKFHLAHAEAYR